jgi:hypothetical protein
MLERGGAWLRVRVGEGKPFTIAYAGLHSGRCEGEDAEEEECEAEIIVAHRSSCRELS